MKNRARSSFEEGERSRGKKIVIASMTLITILMLAFSGCKKTDEYAIMGEDDRAALTESMRESFTTVHLVANDAVHNPSHVDPLLINAWGLSFSNGQVWVSATGSGMSTIYDADGNTMMRPISVPSAGPNGSRLGKPTASVSNPTRSTFIIPATGEVSQMIFVTEDGTIAAWASGSSAITVADRSAYKTVYKGLAVATRNGAWFLYATDFYNGQIDVFDARFNYMGAVGGQFRDPEMPERYAPFGIRGFGDKLVVTYAYQAEGRTHDEPGMGRGFVSIFKSDGTFIKRFASNGRLNSPWGIEAFRPTRRADDAPIQMDSDVERRAILIGNFGDGHVNVYDRDGAYLGMLQNRNEPLTIDGLWALSYKPDMSINDNRLYFTSGPRAETHGIFGYIK